MNLEKLSISDLRALIEKGEVSDPLLFLSSIMDGVDPRHNSQLYTLAQEIEDFRDGKVSQFDWEEVHKLIVRDYKYYQVSLSESVAASKTLAEYMFPKKKQVDVKGMSGGQANQVTDLTEDEIALFKDKFNDGF